MPARNPQSASRSTPSERPFWVWLGAAAVLHAAFVLVSRAEHRGTPVPPARTDLIELSIDAPPANDVPVSAPPAPPEPEHAPADRMAALRPSPVERVPHALVVPDHERGSEEPPSNAAEMREHEAAPGDDLARQTPAPPSSNSAPGEAAPPGRLSLDALGVGAANPFLGMPFPPEGDRGGAPAPRPAPNDAASAARAAERRLENYMVAGMLEHDRKAGAARGGVLVTTLREAAVQIASPVNGQAEFVATFDASGLITSVTAVRASSRPADWQKVAAHAMKQIAKKRVRVPPGAAGLEVRVLVSSKVQLASGHSAGLAMDLVDVPVKKGEGANPTRLSLLPTSQSSTGTVPGNAAGATAAPQNVPMAGGTTLAGLNGDPADIGSAAQRIVHVSITSERAL